MQFDDLPNSAYAVFGVSWGYEIDVGLVVTKRNYQTILRGESIVLYGKGYHYEGEFFTDVWNFSDGLDGRLEVNYGQRKIGDFSAQGYFATPRSALLGTRDDEPPATFEHNGLEFWDTRRFLNEEPTLNEHQGMTSLVELESKESIKNNYPKTTEDKRNLVLGRYADDIELVISEWRRQYPSGSGIAWGYRRALRERSLRDALEKYCKSKKIFPKGEELTKLIHDAHRF